MSVKFLDKGQATDVFVILVAAETIDADVYLELPHIEINALPGGAVEIVCSDESDETEVYGDVDAFACAYGLIEVPA